MDIGHAVVFLRRDGAPLPPGCAGHVGWAFALDDGSYRFGSTENTAGKPLVGPGGDNGAWHDTGPIDAALHAMRGRDYDAFKLATFRHADPAAATARVAKAEASGYRAVGNNCLDHVFHILKSYGQPDLPWPLTHPSPNDWFALYNGEFHNMAGER